MPFAVPRLAGPCLGIPVLSEPSLTRPLSCQSLACHAESLLAQDQPKDHVAERFVRVLPQFPEGPVRRVVDRDPVRLALRGFRGHAVPKGFVGLKGFFSEERPDLWSAFAQRCA